MWFCFSCCKSSASDDLHNHTPGYYQSFRFYAEESTERISRRVSSFDSISANEDDEDGDVDELSELLNSRRAGHARQKSSGWFDFWKKPFTSKRIPNNRRSYNAISTTMTKSRTPSLIPSEQFTSFLTTSSRRNSGGSFYYDDSDCAGDLHDGRQEQYEDFGLADAQLVPDNFVVSVPLRPTKSISYSPANTAVAEDTAVTIEDINSSIHS
ncbi:hypothetical protein V1512DRAFT_261655 [Lipomyces arxii]|uniref:uncharacterized protein n=1 Tax=Lipomyces arxii TaxID=56418 RepID=UPI0034CE6827